MWNVIWSSKKCKSMLRMTSKASFGISRQNWPKSLFIRLNSEFCGEIFAKLFGVDMLKLRTLIYRHLKILSCDASHNFPRTFAYLRALMTSRTEQENEAKPNGCDVIVAWYIGLIFTFYDKVCTCYSHDSCYTVTNSKYYTKLQVKSRTFK